MTHTTDGLTADTAAQLAADAHDAIVRRLGGVAIIEGNPVYRASERRLRTEIARAYGPALVDPIIDLWIDTDGRETLAKCAVVARSEAFEAFTYAEDARYCNQTDDTGESICVLSPGHDGGHEDGVELIPAQAGGAR